MGSDAEWIYFVINSLRHPACISPTIYNLQIMSLVTGIGAQGNVTVSQDMCDWTARIEFNKYELSTRFGVLLFLGEVPNSPQDWLTSPNLVGTHFTYVDGRSHRGNRRGGVVEGFVHLNQGILKHSGLQSLAIEVVEPYLTRALDWRVQTV